jgi:hypothetical protein
MSSYQWQWKTETGWKSYDSTTSDYLEKNYQQNKNGNCPLSIKSTKYTVTIHFDLKIGFFLEYVST